jgi:hypothetical protein
MLGAQGDHPSLLVQRTSSAPSIFVEGTRRIEDKKEEEEASPHCIALHPSLITVHLHCLFDMSIL